MVVTSEGYLYQYNIDLENGGECLLLKQYRFVDEPNVMLFATFVRSFLLIILMFGIVLWNRMKSLAIFLYHPSNNICIYAYI